MPATSSTVEPTSAVSTDESPSMSLSTSSTSTTEPTSAVSTDHADESPSMSLSTSSPSTTEPTSVVSTHESPSLSLSTSSTSTTEPTSVVSTDESPSISLSTSSASTTEPTPAVSTDESPSISLSTSSTSTTETTSSPVEPLSSPRVPRPTNAPTSIHSPSPPNAPSSSFTRHPNDLGNFSHPLSDENRSYLAKSPPFQPTLDDLTGRTFPLGAGRKFNPSWYTDENGNKRSWLTYSIKKDAMLCLPCFLFVSEHSASAGRYHASKEWSERGVSDWKKATGKGGKIKKHEQSEVHKTACHQMAMLIQSESNRTIKEILSAEHSIAEERRRKKVAANRLILKRLTEIILLLAKQNIPFRGHREGDASCNRGNFLELVNHQAKYDEILRKHLETAPKNAVYTHHDIQNELIHLCADNVRSQILEMFDRGYFCIMCDETKDITDVEQMAFVVRFFDNKKLTVQERTLNLVKLKTQDANSIATSILAEVDKYGLDIHKCRGQTYDGAAAMAGCISGVQTQIRAIEPKAVFTHCHAHALNLAVISSCRNTYIRNMFGVLDKLHIFFKGAKRNAVLENHIANSRKLSNHDKLRKLQSLSETRWGCRRAAIESYGILSGVVGDALEELKSARGMDHNTVTEASGLLCSISSFDFVLSLIVADEILKVTNSFAKYLQSPHINLLEFYSTAESTYNKLRDLRIGSKFTELLQKATSKTIQDGFEVPTSVKRSRRDVDGEKVESFYRRNLYFSCLDELTTDFKRRILGQNGRLTSAFGIFSNKCLFKNDPSTTSHLETLSEIYGAEPNRDIEPSVLQTEYQQFKDWVATKIPENTEPDILDLCKLLIDCKMETAYSNIFTLLKIALTFSLTSVSPERSFSELRLLKTYLRSTMEQTRMSSLLVINVNRDIEIDLDKVIDDFAKRSPRRMELLF